MASLVTGRAPLDPIELRSAVRPIRPHAGDPAAELRASDHQFRQTRGSGLGAETVSMTCGVGGLRCAGPPPRPGRRRARPSWDHEAARRRASVGRERSPRRGGRETTAGGRARRRRRRLGVLRRRRRFAPQDRRRRLPPSPLALGLSAGRPRGTRSRSARAAGPLALSRLPPLGERERFDTLPSPRRRRPGAPTRSPVWWGSRRSSRDVAGLDDCARHVGHGCALVP